jgi:putative acetyltransferase
MNNAMHTSANGENACRIEELNAAAEEKSLVAARELLIEYGRFVIAQPGASQFSLGTVELEAQRLPMSFTEQGGGSLLAWVHDEPAGFVAWRGIAESALVTPESWEMKRLWVRRNARGFGLGRLLTQAVLDRAMDAQRKAVYLDTAPESMPSAYRLYLEMGFAPCERYNDNPVEGLAFLVKFL